MIVWGALEHQLLWCRKLAGWSQSKTSGCQCLSCLLQFVAVEVPVRRTVRTSSTPPPASGAVRSVPRGFHLTPAAAQFGVLREGRTYSLTVMMKNIGVDFCRYEY